MSASKAHDLIVALITRKIIDYGYEIAAIESSFEWLFGKGFRLPPAIIHHRPDVIGIRKQQPFIAIGDAKTIQDIGTQRTSEQLMDYANVTITQDKTPCLVIIGIPKSGVEKLRQLITQLRIPNDRISILEIPDVLLDVGTS